MSSARDACGFRGRRARTLSSSKTSSVIVGKDARAFLPARTQSGSLNENGRLFGRKTCKRLRPAGGRVHVWSALACTVTATQTNARSPTS